MCGVRREVRSFRSVPLGGFELTLKRLLLLDEIGVVSDELVDPILLSQGVSA